VQGIRLFILSDSFFRIYKYLKRKKNFSTWVKNITRKQYSQYKDQQETPVKTSSV
jgi:hypothetical protein